MLFPPGSSLGRYTELGNSISFWDGNIMKTPLNDRFNFSIQRQTMANLFTEATFFMHFGHNVQDGSMWGGSNEFNLNQVDPEPVLPVQGLVRPVGRQSVLQSTCQHHAGLAAHPVHVAVSQLLRPYPQYGDLTILGWPGGRDHYYGLALKAERPMAKGLAFMVGYNYNQEYHSHYYNDLATYENKYTM